LEINVLDDILAAKMLDCIKNFY